MTLTPLIEICYRHVLPVGVPAVIPEPYIPYIPVKWNGVLVLGEAQHLGKKNFDYRKWLVDADRPTRVTRLRQESGGLGIAPWDDGTLPFAVEATFGVLAEECAVSNAVPWSQVNANDDNANPSAELVALATGFWKEALPALAPSRVLACGQTARSVFEPLRCPSWQVMFPRLPSTRATASLVNRFREASIATRFPSVAQKAKERPEWLSKYRANKIAYACHMVTLKPG
jgi:hypothetical protein